MQIQPELKAEVDRCLKERSAVNGKRFPRKLWSLLESFITTKRQRPKKLLVTTGETIPGEMIPLHLSCVFFGSP